ncbi:MAG TPA: TonB family protein [Smithella sp.]|nr:TonB family protein [Smithella sp.]
METNKAILWPVIISVLIHVSLLAAAGMIDLRDNVKPLAMISVSLKEPDSEAIKTPASKNNKTSDKIKSDQTQKEKGVDIGNDDWREDTIYLESKDVKYVTYLANIKKKLSQTWNNPAWKYPANSFEKNEEGTVVVKISINADGRLAGASIISSSGYADLDNDALNVAQVTGPFEPLPAYYNLSRLHILASFYYKMTD